MCVCVCVCVRAHSYVLVCVCVRARARVVRVHAQSLTRLAAFMAEYKCMSIELTKGYGNLEFREDIKKLFLIAGVERKQARARAPAPHMTCYGVMGCDVI